MSNGRKWSVILILLGFLTVFAAIIVRNLGESRLRALDLRDNTDAPDSALISVTITSVNPTARELMANIAFRLNGNIAEDGVTPKTNLKLVVNNIRGTQEFDFPEGKRINRIEAIFPLQGEVNRYPLDHYDSTLWFFMGTTAKTNVPSPFPPTPSIVNQDHIPDSGELMVGESALRHNVPIPLSIALSASIPG